MDSFSEKNREKYLEETSGSLDALLNDAFFGEDQNEIRSEFPKGCERNELVYENTKISLSYLKLCIGSRAGYGDPSSNVSCLTRGCS